MKYNIQILSKHNAVLYDMKDIDKTTIAIAVNCPNETPHRFRNPMIKDILYLYFDDITEEQYNKSCNKGKLVLFNTKHARQIHNFIDRNKDIHNIIVHCAMGVSRSGAIGVVLSKYLNGDDLYLYERGSIEPNETVYKLMCEEFNIKFDKEELQRKIKISNKKTNEIVGKMYNDYGLNIDDMFEKGNIKLI